MNTSEAKNKKVTRNIRDNAASAVADNAASSEEVNPADKPQINDIIQVQEFSLFEFCQRVQELIQQGYSFDFDSNDRFPMSYGSLITAGLVKRK